MSKIWEQITKDSWTKGSYSKDQKGEPCLLPYQVPTSWCAVGWILRVYPGQMEAMKSVVEKYIPDDTLVKWNDDPKRTFEEVLDLFKRADI